MKDFEFKVLDYFAILITSYVWFKSLVHKINAVWLSVIKLYYGFSDRRLLRIMKIYTIAFFSLSYMNS